MTDKNSAKTEDEILDQTFGGFDTQMTDQGTMGDGSDAGQQPANTSEKKKSSNTMLFVGGGVAAVVVVGYMMFLKPMMSGAPQQAPVAQAQPQNQAPVAPVTPVQPETPAPAPVVAAAPVAAPVVPTPPVVDPAANTNANNPAAAFLSGQNTPSPAPAPTVDPVVAAAPVAAPVVPTPPVVEPTPVSAPAISIPAPTNVAPVTTPVASGSGNSQPVAVVEELKGMFDRQTSEFKVVLDDVGGRVSAIEKRLDGQETVNKGFDQRITALEQGKRVAPAAKPKAEGSSSDAAPKKVVQKKPVAKKPAVNSGDVLVDKSAMTPTSTKKPAAATAMKQEQPVAAALPSLDIHSIYSGRLWLRNADGSLSTYQAGDRLPSGEVVKSINSETFEVVTDKRKLK